MPTKNTLTSIIIGASLLLLPLFTDAQIIGSGEAGGKSPQEVTASALTDGGLSGDVNVFNGTYQASFPLGAVSTPGGLSFALNLSYANQFSAGDTPPIISGVPYGEGWSCNIPTLRVSTDAYHKYTYAQNCALASLSQPASTRGWGTGESLAEGDLYWFAPELSLPGTGAGSYGA